MSDPQPHQQPADHPDSPDPSTNGENKTVTEVETGRQIRHNPITNRDVIIAPLRGGRPRQTDAAPNEPPAERHPDCPFCPGQEERLPRIIDERPAPGNEGPWQTRVVPNKYPALVPAPPQPSPPAADAPEPLHRREAAAGRQEVVIESPVHGRDLADLSVPALEAVIATYQSRLTALRASGDRLIPFLFRNYGSEAGASLAHPHSQLIATRLVPAPVEDEETRAQAHYASTGRCLYCDIVRTEAAGPRVVAVTEGFLAFVPFAAEAPCEMVLLPTGHQARFVEMGEGPRRAFAKLLGRTLRALRSACGDPAYNFYLRTPATPGADLESLHWYLRVVPRTKVEAGFELSTGLSINPSSPEADAAHLRAHC